MTLDGKVVGSSLIGQEFKGKRRTSTRAPRRPDTPATSPSSATLGPNSVEAREEVRENLAAYLELEKPYDHGLTKADVPVDAVTQSASGVDPHISRGQRADPGAPDRRRPRPAARPRSTSLISTHTDGRSLGLLGEPGVNVLELNIALDKEAPLQMTAPRPAAPARLVRPRDPAPGAARVAAQARPAGPGPQPGHVRGRDRRRDHHRRLADPGLRRRAARRRPRAGLVHLRDHDLALADGRLRQPRRGAGRGPRPRPGGEPARDAHRDDRADCATAARSPPPSWSAATSSWSRRGRGSPATAP